MTHWHFLEGHPMVTKILDFVSNHLSYELSKVLFFIGNDFQVIFYELEMSRL